MHAGEDSFRKPSTSPRTKESEDDFILNYEPLNPLDRQRIDVEPVGLKNIGNSNIRLFIISP